MRFVVVYQREPHARQLAFEHVPQPTTRDERTALARQLRSELALDVDVWIDEGDAARAAFGSLPNWAIVVDPAGAVHLKLPWAEPAVLGVALAELAAELPDPRPTPRDAQFLAAITEPAAGGDAAVQRHHRHTMLAHLAVRHPEHPERDAWIRELAADASPLQQRQWALRLQQAAAPRASGEHTSDR